ncbi:MAG: hypothetical protein FWD71_14965 [Oscillospiraceae bacterium]|nr:hypothetical protein [Oscillospiraceae bacterium]
MKTKKQEELINSFISSLSPFGDEIGPVYKEIIMYLSEVGYNPYKQRSYIVFKHDLHNKQMAKTGIRINKDKSPFFALRFSACRGYSQRFADIVRMAVSADDFSEANCLSGKCGYCAGEPDTHVYKYTLPSGEIKSHCGAVALEIPDITAKDICEIKKLIKEEHEYLLKHQASVLE